MKKMQPIIKTILKTAGVWILLGVLYIMLKPNKQAHVTLRPVVDTALIEAAFYRNLDKPEDVATDR
jgi:hypothetical protein